MVNDRIRALVGIQPGETFPRFTSLGSYPLIYLDKDGEVLCAKCADEETEELQGADVFLEGSPEQCAGCNKEIKSAYGDPDDEEDEEDEEDDSDTDEE